MFEAPRRWCAVLCAGERTHIFTETLSQVEEVARIFLRQNREVAVSVDVLVEGADHL